MSFCGALVNFFWYLFHVMVVIDNIYYVLMARFYSSALHKWSCTFLIAPFVIILLGSFCLSPTKSVKGKMNYCCIFTNIHLFTVLDKQTNNIRHNNFYAINVMYFTIFMNFPMFCLKVRNVLLCGDAFSRFESYEESTSIVISYIAATYGSAKTLEYVFRVLAQ